MRITSILGSSLAGILTLISSSQLLLFNYETAEYKDMSVNPVILDLDFCGDVDDAVAVRVATLLDEMNVCSLKAVGLTTTSPEKDGLEVKALHGILSYDGYENIPIGKDTIEYVETKSKYWEALAEYSTTEPCTKDAVELYKDILKQSYNKVTIITTGYLTNIEELLKDKEGYQLLKNKCKQLVIMGGSLDNGWENNFGFHKQAVAATKYVFKFTPCDILFVPQDFAADIKAGEIIQINDKNDPIAKALSAWGTEDGRTAWDPYTTLIGCLPEGAIPLKYNNVETTVYSNGEVYFGNSSEDTSKRLIQKDDKITAKQYQKIIEGILGYKWPNKDLASIHSK